MEAVYELSFLDFDDNYFAIGLFKSLGEANQFVDSAIESGDQLAWDVEDNERLQIVKYQFGKGDNLRIIVRTITRTPIYIEDEDDYTLKVVSDK